MLFKEQQGKFGYMLHYIVSTKCTTQGYCIKMFSFMVLWKFEKSTFLTQKNQTLGALDSDDSGHLSKN